MLKFKGFSHAESWHSDEQKLNISNARECVRKVVFETYFHFLNSTSISLPIDESFPKYLRQNQQRFAEFIFDSGNDDS